MNLIYRLSNFKFNLKVRKRMKLFFKLQDLKKDYEEMNERVQGSPLRLDFVHKCKEEKISNLEVKLEKIDKEIEREISVEV